MVDEETTTLDATVESYKLDIAICPNFSGLVKRDMNVPSDMMFDHDAMFLVKRVAHMELGVEASTLQAWNPTDCRRFYQENHLASKFDFNDTFINSDKRSLSAWYFSGRSSHYMRFLEYRWNNEMVFTGYKERVNIALDMLMKDSASSAQEVIDKMRAIEQQKAAINDELEKLVASDAISERLKHVLSSVNIDPSDLV